MRLIYSFVILLIIYATCIVFLFTLPCSSTQIGTQINCSNGLQCRNNKCQALGHINIKSTNIEATGKQIILLFAVKQDKHSIKQVELLHQVKITQNYGDLSASCERGIYRVHDKLFTLIGSPIIKDSANSIFVEDKIIFDENKDRATTFGRVTVKRKSSGRIFLADKVLLYFVKDNMQNRKISSINISGDVTISTEGEIIKADKGKYNPVTGILELFENIRITRKNGQLFGKYAQYNVNTGQFVVREREGRTKVVLIQ